MTDSSRSTRFCSSVIDGLITIDHREFAAFLYEESEYDPEKIDEGLCRGNLLLKV